MIIRRAVMYGAKVFDPRGFSEYDLSRVNDAARTLLEPRDRHHGLWHANRVAFGAAILAKKIAPELENIVCAVAMSHDIGDGKVDPDGTIEQEYAKELRSSGIDIRAIGFILDISDRVSFSREQRLGRKDWDIHGADGRIVRDIVSDVDKIESMGKDGYQRLLDYNAKEEDPVAQWRACGKVIRTRQIYIPAVMCTEWGKRTVTPLLEELILAHDEHGEKLMGGGIGSFIDGLAVGSLI